MTSQPGPQASLRTVTGRQANTAGAVLVASHHEYPAFRSLFPDPVPRRRALQAFFTATVRDATHAGQVHAAVDDTTQDGEQMLGVAVWLPPGASSWTAGRKLRAAPKLLQVAVAAPGSFRRFAQTGANAEAANPGADQWYLAVLGVHPRAHRRGIGSRLLTHGLQHADRCGHAVGLHTSDPTNIAFYERFGFAVADPHVQLVPAGPPHVAMHRPARTP